MIAQLAKSDLKNFAQIYAAIFPDKKITLKTVQNILKEDTTVWLVKEGQEIVAFLYFWELVDEIHIMDVGVLPNRRRQGQAVLLFQEIFKKSKKVFLEVSSKNQAAILLYEKLGFAQTGKRRAYYKDGSDALLYER